MSNQQQTVPLWANILCGSVAGSTAELFTIPIDTAKVRLQLQGQKKAEVGPSFVPKYKGMFHTLGTIFREEGLRSLWKGIFAGLQRQVVFGGLRIGLYGPVRDLICGKLKEGQQPSLAQRIYAGLITGAFGILVACPTDVVKIRLQAEGKKPEGVPRKYKGSIDAYQKIVREEGFKGLYSGLGANIVRNSVMNAAELASYDQIKSSVLNYFPSVRPEDKRLHFVCGLAAGFVGVVCASPADVTKTRLMNNPDKYKGAVDCVLKTLKVEGPLAFYNGFAANFWRVGTWNIICFTTLEQCQIYAKRQYVTKN